MMTQVVPTLASTFRDMHSELPMSTKAVIALSDFLVNNSALAFLMVVVAISLLAAAMTTQIGKRVEDFVFLRLPAIGTLVKEVNTARTARTLSSLLSAGVDVLTALAITRDVVQNSYFREVLVDAENRVRAGEPLSLSFARREDLYPPFVAEMMIVGEETGETGPMLERLAQHYENEVDEKTKDLSTIIEPILMLVIGAAVGFFAVSMISPIYSISENL